MWVGVSDDPEMEKAIERARASFRYLWRELTWEYRRIVPALDLAAIKVAFHDPGHAGTPPEHMWVSEVEFDGELIGGVLMNSPNRLQSVEEGDQVVLRVRQVEDWMYGLRGCAYGGFTVQVLRGRMSVSERRGHDDAWGLKFPEPGRVDLAPNWEETTKNDSGEKCFAQGDSLLGDPDAEHPMSQNAAIGLAEALSNDREGFLRLGPDGLNTLHSLALGGSWACMKVLLEQGVDPSVKTSRGKTAEDLAVVMGWPKVVDLLRRARSR